MSRTLLIVQSHAAGNDITARHWPYYELAGLDIAGIGRTNTDCKWPNSPRLIANATATALL
jgi:hypothetical protein